MINKQKISTFAFSSLNLGSYPNNCYEDKSSRDLDHYFPLPSRNVAPDSVLWCRTTCGTNNYDYAGVQNGNQCFCGNSYGEFGQKDDSDCNKTCPDGVNICGGTWRNNIYHSIK